ncbi:MAG: DKNYY domain-containing protein [Candidatus Moranbacteria bacterium]|nr:DKNYY domain-containing protein [Candidatus Moranbacteria bacterium]
MKKFFKKYKIVIFILFITFIVIINLKFNIGKNYYRSLFSVYIKVTPPMDLVDNPSPRYIKIRNVNLTSFKVLSEYHGTDKNNVYYEWFILQDADPKTFKSLDYEYGKDKNNVFYHLKKMENADTETFEVLDRIFYAKDKNNCYKNGEKVKMSKCQKLENQK